MTSLINASNCMCISSGPKLTLVQSGSFVNPSCSLCNSHKTARYFEFYRWYSRIEHEFSFFFFFMIIMPYKGYLSTRIKLWWDEAVPSVVSAELLSLKTVLTSEYGHHRLRLAPLHISTKLTTNQMFNFYFIGCFK